MGALVHHNNMNPDEAKHNIQIANGFDIGATIYVGRTILPAGVAAFTAAIPEAGELGPLAVQATKQTVIHYGKYVAPTAYAGIVIPISSLTVTNPEAHTMLEEIWEEPWRQEIIEQVIGK